MDVTYTHQTRFTGYLARPYVKANGDVDPDWFLVLIEGTEHARHRSEYVYDRRTDSTTREVPSATNVKTKALFDQFIRWFNKNVAGQPLATSDEKTAVLMLARFCRIHGVQRDSWEALKTMLNEYRKV